MKEVAQRIGCMADLDEHQVCYWKDDCGWWLYLPRCGAAVLRQHAVVENADGSITVTPSIRMTGHSNGEARVRHGYLTRGVWNEC